MPNLERVVPVLIYQDIAAAHDFLVRAFGFDSQPIDQPYGRREYGARDLEGHRWWFGTPTAGRRGEEEP